MSSVLEDSLKGELTKDSFYKCCFGGRVSCSIFQLRLLLYISNPGRHVIHECQKFIASVYICLRDSCNNLNPVYSVHCRCLDGYNATVLAYGQVN